jgi:hypothetical protein
VHGASPAIPVFKTETELCDAGWDRHFFHQDLLAACFDSPARWPVALREDLSERREVGYSRIDDANHFGL